MSYRHRIETEIPHRRITSARPSPSADCGTNVYVDAAAARQRAALHRRQRHGQQALVSAATVKKNSVRIHYFCTGCAPRQALYNHRRSISQSGLAERQSKFSRCRERPATFVETESRPSVHVRRKQRRNVLCFCRSTHARASAVYAQWRRVRLSVCLPHSGTILNRQYLLSTVNNGPRIY